jgi:hypothetical protein
MLIDRIQLRAAHVISSRLSKRGGSSGSVATDFAVVLFGGSLSRLNVDLQFHDHFEINLISLCGKSPF